MRVEFHEAIYVQTVMPTYIPVSTVSFTLQVHITIAESPRQNMLGIKGELISANISGLKGQRTVAKQEKAALMQEMHLRDFLEIKG